jgi:hypothetical protein
MGVLKGGVKVGDPLQGRALEEGRLLEASGGQGACHGRALGRGKGGSVEEGVQGLGSLGVLAAAVGTNSSSSSLRHLQYLHVITLELMWAGWGVVAVAGGVWGTTHHQQQQQQQELVSRGRRGT